MHFLFCLCVCVCVCVRTSLFWSEWVEKAGGMEKRNCADHIDIVEFCVLIAEQEL